MKYLHFLLITLVSCLFVSCWGLHGTLPPTVTDPAAVETFNKAKNGDGEALYQMSLMYRKGLNGFPKSSVRARTTLQKAAQADPPCLAACFDYFRANIRAKQDTIWARALRCFCIAAYNGEPRAAALYESRNEYEWEREPLGEARRLVRMLDVAEKGLVPCPVCHGRGIVDYESQETVGSYYDYYNKTRVYQTRPVLREKSCGYCSMFWRKTGCPGYVRP